MEAVKPVDRGFKGEFAPRDLEPLNQVGCAGEHDAPAVFHDARPIADAR